MILFGDCTLLRLLPLLRAAWAPAGAQAKVLSGISGQNAPTAEGVAAALTTHFYVPVMRMIDTGMAVVAC